MPHDLLYQTIVLTIPPYFLDSIRVLIPPCVSLFLSLPLRSFLPRPPIHFAFLQDFFCLLFFPAIFAAYAFVTLGVGERRGTLGEGRGRAVNGVEGEGLLKLW